MNKIISTTVALSFFTVGLTAQTIISVNIADQNNSGSLIATDETAGAVAVQNWNNFLDGTATPITLNDSSGSSTAATFFFSGGTIFREKSSTNPDIKLMANLANGGNFTVSNLPTEFTSNGYMVYFYFSNDAQEGNVMEANLEPSGGSAITLYGKQRDPAFINATPTPSFTNATSTTEGGATTDGDYILFENLTASGFTLGGSYTTLGPSGLAGIQIVAVPENTTYAMILGLFCVAFFLYRRRGH